MISLCRRIFSSSFLPGSRMYHVIICIVCCFCCLISHSVLNRSADSANVLLTCFFIFIFILSEAFLDQPSEKLFHSARVWP